MLDNFRKFGPALMVPGAWITTAIALETSILSSREMMIAHIVMTSLMAIFLATGWDKMKNGVLKAWRTTIVIGLVITATGLVGFLGSDQPVLMMVSLYGWMILPAPALIYTGLKDKEYGKIYVFSGLLTLLGVVVYLMQMFNPFSEQLYVLSGLSLVALGQTLGILTAVYQNF